MSLSPNMSSDPLSQRPAIGQFLNAGLFWLIVATLGALAFFWNGIDALLVAWQLPEYSHGPLIPLLSLLLFLRQLKTEPVHLGPQRDRWPGVVLLIVAMGFGMLGNFSGIDDVVAYALILWVGAILLIFTVMVFLLTIMGRFLGGRGDLDAVMKITVWLQALRLLAQIIISVLSLAIPFLGSLFALAVGVWGLWVLVVFIAAAHQFETVKGFGTLLGTFVATVFALSILSGILGLGVPSGGL